MCNLSYISHFSKFWGQKKTVMSHRVSPRRSWHGTKISLAVLMFAQMDLFSYIEYFAASKSNNFMVPEEKSLLQDSHVGNTVREILWTKCELRNKSACEYKTKCKLRPFEMKNFSVSLLKMMIKITRDHVAMRSHQLWHLSTCWLSDL